jgi:hypothetical protein
VRVCGLDLFGLQQGPVAFSYVNELCTCAPLVRWERQVRGLQSGNILNINWPT